MLNVNAFEKHVVARLLDFFDSKTPWQRGLWASGVVLTLREVLQASEALAAGVLTPAPLHSVAAYAVELVGRDPAFGDTPQKKILQGALRTDAKNGGIHFNGVDYKIVQHLAGALKPGFPVPSKVNWIWPKSSIFGQMESSAVMAFEQVKVARTRFCEMPNCNDNSVIVRYGPQPLIECPMGILG